MADIEQAVGIAAKLYKIRDTAKFLWGDEYQTKMAEWRDGIEKVAIARNVDHLKAAMLLGEKPKTKVPTRCFSPSWRPTLK